MTIMDILVKDAVILNLGVRSKSEVLAEMAAALAKVEPQIDGDQLVVTFDLKSWRGRAALGLLCAAALGLPHAALGQAILLLVTPAPDSAAGADLEAAVLAHCLGELPNFMVPTEVVGREAFPHNQNGKIDRRVLAEEYQHLFRDK